MARKTLDATANENLSTTLSKIEDNFVELYNADASNTNWSGTSVTATGAIAGGTLAATTTVTAATVAATGAVTGATATVTGLATSGSFKLDTGTKTATAVAGAATLNKSSGIVTSEALTTAAGSAYTLTLTNSTIAAADLVIASIAGGTSTAGLPILLSAVADAGSVVIVVHNAHSADALNGTLKIAFAVLKA